MVGKAGELKKVAETLKANKDFNDQNMLRMQNALIHIVESQALVLEVLSEKN